MVILLPKATQPATSPTERPNTLQQLPILLVRYVLKVREIRVEMCVQMCTHRRRAQVVRARRNLLVQLAICFVLGCLCGQIHGTNAEVKASVTFYALFHAAFAVIVAMTTLNSFGGAVEQVHT